MRDSNQHSIANNTRSFLILLRIKLSPPDTAGRDDLCPYNNSSAIVVRASFKLSLIFVSASAVKNLTTGRPTLYFVVSRCQLRNGCCCFSPSNSWWANLQQSYRFNESQRSCGNLALLSLFCMVDVLTCVQGVLFISASMGTTMMRVFDHSEIQAQTLPILRDSSACW